MSTVKLEIKCNVDMPQYEYNYTYHIIVVDATQNDDVIQLICQTLRNDKARSKRFANISNKNIHIESIKIL
jgi:hypothetical protein